MMKRSIFVFLVIILMAFTTACGKSSETIGDKDEKSYTLKIHMVVNEQDPVYLGYSEFKKAVEKRTNGKVKIELYPNGVLGSDEDLLQQAMLGGNIAVNSDAGRLGVWVPEIGILLAPYLTDSVDEMQKLVKSDLVKGWLDKLSKEKGLMVLSFNYYTGARNFVTKKGISTPEDLKGLKIRTPGSPVWQETIKALGASPVSLPWTETYPALEQGVIDGAEAQDSATDGAKLYEIAKYISKTGHIQLWNCLVVGAKWFESLPQEYQQILIEESTKAGDFTTNKVLTGQKELEDKMTREGAVIREVDIALFKEKTKIVYDKLYKLN
jgi:tripartite ATP-independent transporter DctP family solute receptor